MKRDASGRAGLSTANFKGGGRTDGQKIESLDELVLYGWMERPDQAGVREESLL